MGEHTKGPWEVVKQPYGVTGILSGSYWVVGNVDVPIENEADAHLIAAAPDLLAYAECEEAITNDRPTSPYDHVFRRHGYDGKKHGSPGAFLDRLRKAAIAKATGATP